MSDQAADQGGTAPNGVGKPAELQVLQRFFSAVERRDHLAIAECYADDAYFEDIAFTLSGRREIHAMWCMIAASDMRMTYSIDHADKAEGQARWTAVCTYGASLLGGEDF